MPELPEVETIRRALAPVLVGARLARVEARRPDLRFPLPEGFVQRLTGARIAGLDRRGKFLVAALDYGPKLLMHLGMSGRFEISAGAGARQTGAFALAAPADPKHAHVLFETDGGVTVTYFDARRFGFMEIVAANDTEGRSRLDGLGPEPLGELFDQDYLEAAFAGRRQNVKTLLLDQRLVAGLGNIYVCEALHRACVSPLKPAADIAVPQLGPLVDAIRSVLTEAILKGGSTLRDYASADGALGYFQHSFEAYGREGQACQAEYCNGVIERVVQGGRSTFFCPACQT